MSFDPPKSRNEAILQNMLGANNALDPPKSRVEELLLQILQQGGSGGGVSPEQIEAAVEAYLAEHPAPQGPKGDTGDTGPQGPKGDTYALTNQDKQDIAGIVVNLIPSAESNSFGGA